MALPRLLALGAAATLIVVIASLAFLARGLAPQPPRLGNTLGGLPGTMRPPPRRFVGPIRMMKGVPWPTKTRHVEPAYPEAARASGVEGIVVVELIVGPQGTVQEARVVRSIPGLDAAALDAARQWTFTPTLLNGEAMSIVVTLTVKFELPQAQADRPAPGQPRGR